MTTILQQEDLITKMDDSKGFHLLAITKESRDLCAFEFQGRYFCYYVLPFGERRSPGSFQQANTIPLNYARLQGITVTLYLDDRMVLEPKDLTIGDEKIDPKWARSTYLVLLLVIATGGFVNMAKSNFDPTMSDEFLGMDLNTKDCIVSIPTKKWEAFQLKLKSFYVF